MTDWRGIESAPKDGSLILVTGCSGRKTVLAAWWVGDNEAYGHEGKAHWRGVVNDQGPIYIADPTHWMELPAPPAE